MSWKSNPWIYAGVSLAIGSVLLFESYETLSGPVDCHGHAMAKDEICHRVGVGNRVYKDLDYEAKKADENENLMWTAPLGVLFVVGGGLAVGFRRRFGESLLAVEESRN